MLHRRSLLSLAFDAVFFITGLVLGGGLHLLLAVLGWGWRFGKAALAAGPAIRCPRGCTQPADATWRCRCGAVEDGWVWAPCRACGAVPGYVTCKCGRAIVNPTL